MCKFSFGEKIDQISLSVCLCVCECVCVCVRERDALSSASSQAVFLCRRDLIMTTSMTLSSQRSELPGQCHTPGWTLVHLPRTMCAAVDSGHFLLFSQRRQPSNKSRTKTITHSWLSQYFS